MAAVIIFGTTAATSEDSPENISLEVESRLRVLKSELISAGSAE